MTTTSTLSLPAFTSLAEAVAHAGAEHATGVAWEYVFVTMPWGLVGIDADEQVWPAERKAGPGVLSTLAVVA